MAYPNLPDVEISEVDKSQTPDTAIGDLFAASVIGSKWGNPDLTLLEKPADLVREYTVRGIPDVGDVGFFCAHCMLSLGVPLYLKREESGKCANIVCRGTSTATANSGDPSGIDWDSAGSYSFGTSEVFVVVFYPGVYGEQFGTKISEVDSANKTFEMEFYRKNDAGTLELQDSITLSRKKQLDNFGNQLYLEDRILQFDLPCKIIDNTVIDEDEEPNVDVDTIVSDGGTDGTAPTGTDIVSGWTDIGDSEKDFRLMCSFAYDGSGAVATKIAALTATRSYNVGLADAPDGNQTAVSAWRTNWATSSNRMGIFCERFKYLDEFNNTWLWLPPTPIIAALISENRNNNEPFKAFAGLRRGRFSALGLKWNYSKSDMNTLLGEQVNPLTRLGGSYLLIDNLTSQTMKSVLSNLQVRFLFDYVEEIAEEFLMYYIQEYNNEETREAVETGLQDVLDMLMNNGDLQEGSYVQCDDTNNTPIIIDSEKMVVDIFLKPYRVAKKIQVNIVAMKTGASAITES